MGDYSNQNISAKQAGYKDAYASSTDPSQEIKDQEDKVDKALANYAADIANVQAERKFFSDQAQAYLDKLKSDPTGKTASEILGIFLLKINNFETSDQLAPTFGRVDVSNQVLALQNLMTKEFGQSLNLTSLAGYDFGDLGKVKEPLTFDNSGNVTVIKKDGTEGIISPSDISKYSTDHGIYFKLSDLGITFSGNPIAGPPSFKATGSTGADIFANAYIQTAHTGYFNSLRASCNSVATWLNGLVDKGVDKTNPFFKENPDLINSMSLFLSKAISSNDPLSTQEAQNLVFTKDSEDSISACQTWTSDAASQMSAATGAINSISQKAAVMAQTEENMAKGFLDASKNIVQQSLQALQKISDNMH